MCVCLCEVSGCKLLNELPPVLLKKTVFMCGDADIEMLVLIGDGGNQWGFSVVGCGSVAVESSQSGFTDRVFTE